MKTDYQRKYWINNKKQHNDDEFSRPKTVLLTISLSELTNECPCQKRQH